jgi:type III pantothenate kinase
MAYLIIDAGNTRIKVFVFEEDTLVLNAVLEIGSFEKKILKIFRDFQIHKTILSSVGSFQERIVAVVSEKSELVLLSSKTSVPFKNLYGTPNTLGVDRIALVSAASVCFPCKNVLIIDAGTCVTFDLLNNKNEYLGGGIAPGLKMRYKALHTFTEKLPNLEFKDPKELVGKNTEGSIHSGVVNGLVAEVKGVLEQYEQRYPDLTIVLTGGDMIYLSKRLKNSIFANPNFLIEGLHAILKHETQK